MALFKSIPAVSTQKDTTGPMKKKPSGEYKEENLKAKPPISDEEAENALAKEIKPLVDEPDPVVEDDFVMPEEVKEEAKPKEEPKKEEPKPEVKEQPKEEAKPKKVVLQKPIVKEAPKEEAKPKEEPKKVEPKEEPKEVKAEVSPQPKEEPKEEEKPLTLAERRMLNLQRAREARLKQQERENNTMAQAKQTTQEEKAKKPAPKPKKAVDMSKMVMTTKKPAAAQSGKTVYHVSKRGETREDRVWKVFIQESNKVIKLFDYQADALEYAKSLAKNKNDGSYVILHGLDGKIRKY